MARYRTIKPEFWTSEQVAECSVSARLLFIGLWNFCDDGGVHPFSLKRIKMEVFPADAIEVSPLIKELIGVGLLQSYEVNGEKYLHVTGWHHQKIERPTFKYPPPPNGDAPAEDASNGGGEIRRVVGDASANDRRPLAPERSERREERSGTSGVEQSRKEREGRVARRSPVDSSPGIQEALKQVDWDAATRCACFIRSRAPVKSKEDALAWCRVAVLLQTTFAESWLADSLESVKLQKPAKPAAYLLQTLKLKAAEQGHDLIGLMKKIRIRDDVLAEVLDA